MNRLCRIKIICVAWIFFSFAWLFWLPAGWAAITASVDRSTIALGESVQLTLAIRANSAQTPDNPDFSALETDFTIAGTSQNTQVQIINGQMEAQKSWELTLMPKRAGTLQIPEITIGNEKTLPIPLEVTSTPSSTPTTGEDIQLEASVDNLQPLVQSQVRYTLRLYVAARLQGGELADIEAPQAIIKRIGQDRRYETTRQKRRYEVIERVYAVFPQASGTLTIPGPLFKGTVLDSNPRQTWDPFAILRGKPVYKTANPITLTVLPKPANAGTGAWLPALQIKLEETWSEPSLTLTTNQSLTRTITLTAQGISAAQLPDLSLEPVNGLTQYPDKAETQTLPQGQNLTIRREQKIAYQALQAGQYTLPEVRIDWWDTVNQRPASTVLPAQVLTVTAPANTATLTTPNAMPTTLPPIATQKITPTPQPAAPAPTPPVTPSAANPPTTASYWPWVSAIFAGLWLLTLGAWLLMQYRLAKQARILAQTVDTTVPTTLKQAYQALKQSCLQMTAIPTVRHALLQWGQARWPHHPPRNLVELAERLDNIGKQAVMELDARAYAPTSATTPWDSVLFWQVAGPSFTGKTDHPAPDSILSLSTPLPSLYPTAGNT